MDRAGAEPPHYRIYGDYAGSEPGFYDAEEFPWVATLRRSSAVIRAEFDDYVGGRGGVLRPNFAPDAVELRGWLGVTLFTCLRRNRRSCPAFPRTVAILESVPNLVSAFINVLEPGSNLPPHHGETNVCYRAHLGLSIPGGVDACGMQVGAEAVGWREGDVVVFNDARKHFVWNRSPRPRVILVVDVMKPEYGGATPWTCGRVLGAIAVMYAQSRVASLRRLPRPVTGALHAGASLPFQTYLSLFGMRRPRPEPADVRTPRLAANAGAPALG